MIQRFLIGFIAVLSLMAFSCTEKGKPKVVYDTGKTENITEKKDTTSVEIADLPIRIDTTNYLIHPIGNYRIYKSRSKIISGLDYGRDNVNFSISRSSDYEISGNLTNLKFQHIDSVKLTSLTDQALKIRSVTFLIETYKKSKVANLIYRITDADSNKDGKIDYQDLESLYISKIDGTNFKKLTPKYHQLVRWHSITSIDKLYFKTVEDINKDGEFDRKDKIHYYYLDLNNTGFNTIEYFPL